MIYELSVVPSVFGGWRERSVLINANVNLKGRELLYNIFIHYNYSLYITM